MKEKETTERLRNKNGRSKKWVKEVVKTRNNSSESNIVYIPKESGVAVESGMVVQLFLLVVALHDNLFSNSFSLKIFLTHEGRIFNNIMFQGFLNL